MKKLCSLFSICQRQVATTQGEEAQGRACARAAIGQGGGRAQAALASEGETAR